MIERKVTPCLFDPRAGCTEECSLSKDSAQHFYLDYDDFEQAEIDEDSFFDQLIKQFNERTSEEKILQVYDQIQYLEEHGIHIDMCQEYIALPQETE